ncbi:MAG: hypothetical protein M8349_07080 [ANME-2 cluster archaeon]|nr:hypothetical protein [ANME-2 cluster archaeon]MDF1556978.1 hypothetical protein [ANME-2 cluster archaeon]
MDHSEKIFDMVKKYEVTRSIEGKDYVVKKLRNSFRYLNKTEHKITMAIFVVLELNRNQKIDSVDIAEKISCLTNLDKHEVFSRLPEYMADYLTMAG